MPIAESIPTGARSIVNRIKKSVPRPSEKSFSRGRFCRHLLTKCCPMGMLPYALHSAPYKVEHFTDKKISIRAIQSFWKWWDAQRDHKAAIEAIWGKE